MLLNFIEAHMPRKSKRHLNYRVAAPSEPACFQNPVFKQCIENIFATFENHLVDMRIFVSGGCLSRTYLDPNMSEGHRLSFGDIDFKLPSCTAEEQLSLLSYCTAHTPIDEDGYLNSSLVEAFADLLQQKENVKKAYYKQNRLVINIEWRGVAVDFVLFRESLVQHAENLDISVGAGFYNPRWNAIYFPCDGIVEIDKNGMKLACDRSAKDFKNKELNLVFPHDYWRVFDQDPIRILRIVQAVSRSDYTLSTVLRESITNYLCNRRDTVFSEINPDRLYYNLKSLFFSGHAIKNFHILMELNLLKALFLNLSHLSPDSKKIVFYLIECVAAESDNNYLLSSSLLFYAVYWETIKDKSYDQNVIFELSNGKIKLPTSNNGLGKKEIFDETVHKNNIEYLQTCEREYKDHHKHESFSDDKLGADVLFFGDLNNPISVVVSSSPIPAAEHILFDVNDWSFPEPIIALPQHDTHTYTQAQSDNDLPPELESVETKKSASVVVSPRATEPRPLGSGNPRVFARDLESTDETMTKPQKLNNKKSKKKNKADNRLVVDEYSIYKEHCQKAIALLDSKKYKEAGKVFGDAIKSNSAWPDAYCGLGQVCQKLAEECNPAISALFHKFQVLQEDSTKNKIAIEDCVKNHTAHLQTQNKRYREATNYYQQALANDPDYNQASLLLEIIANIKQFNPIVAVRIPNDNRGTPALPKKKKPNKNGKSPCPSQAVEKLASVLVNSEVDPYEQQQKRTQDMLRKAQQEENAGNDLKAIECYKQLFTQSHSLASGYKCIFLYKKLGRYQDALKYATKLVMISKENHSRVYDNQSVSEEKPFDNYLYHHCYALYQRGKLHLKLKNSTEATVDFDAMLSTKEDDNFDVSVIDIVIRSYIKLGQYYCSLAYESQMVSRIHYVDYMQESYEKVYNFIKLLGIVNHDRVSDIYLGFGDVERFKNKFNEANVYYEKALEVINSNIDNKCYPVDCIYQKFYQYAEHIGGPLVNQLSMAVLNKQLFILSENAQYLLNLVHKVCVRSIIYSYTDYQESHIMLFKIAVILGHYDAVISDIKHIMSGDFKKTKCSKRELFLLLGVCHEQKLDYDMATQCYVKAQQARYDDDTDKYKELTALAEMACIRVAKSKKESIKNQNLLLKGVELVRTRACFLMENGKRAQIEGRFDDAQSYYRDYLLLACAAASEPTASNNQFVMYNLFYQFAHSIISQDVIEEGINNVLFTENEVTSLPDFNYLDLLNDIYLEAVKYTSSAHLNLIFIAVFRRDYDGAIERIKMLIDKKIIDVRSSTRELHYICGKMHELKADSVGAKAYYEVSASFADYSDDNESSPIVRAASTSQLQKIIGDELPGVLNSNTFLVATKEGTNPYRLFSEKNQIPVTDQNGAAIQHSEISLNTMDGADCS